MRLSVPGIAVRRVFFFGLVGGTTAIGATMMTGLMATGGIGALEIVILTLFVPSFAWITLSFWNASIGFALGMIGRDPLTLRKLSGAQPDGAEAPLASRTAVVMPVHNEDPGLIVRGLGAVVNSLETTGLAAHFDVHLLSDTTDPARAREEERAWRRMRNGAPHPHRLHYRRRPANSGRKAGNLAEFCRRCRDAYDLVVVLDADSVMSGSTLVELVRLMQANPDAGLIQTVPIPARQDTRFGRFVQLASTLYAPMLAAGQSFWQGDASNYWGHNAILRLRPFEEHARLPVLPGSPPLGGPVLSHDFVEAALLRSAGWGVYLVPWIGGSWEGVPGNVVDFARRDRRWAQGSLQHLRLIGLPGLHPLSRLHFLLGATGYLASVLWLLTLIAGTVYVLGPGLGTLPIPGGIGAGFPVPPSLVDAASRLRSLLPLLAGTALVLFGPKAMGLLLALRHRRAEFGGALRLTAGAFTEAAFSVVVAPVMMLHHARFVTGILAGRAVAWETQPREGRHVGWSEAVRTTGWMTATVAVWAMAILLLSPPFLPWMAPIFLGPLFAAAIVRGTSTRVDVSGGPRLLATPSEVCIPPELGPPDARISVGRATPARPMFLTQPDPEALAPIGSMYEAERALFDLQRGRAVLVTPSDVDRGVRPVLVAAVEGLTEGTLKRLHDLGCGPLRLLVTGHRVAAMGWAGNGHPAIGAVWSIGLDRAGSDEILRIASSHSAPHVERSRLRPGRAGERAGLRLLRLGRMLPAAVAVETDIASAPELATLVGDGAILTVTAEQITDLAGRGDQRVEVTYVSDAPVPIEEAENVRFMLFREANALTEHVAILIGERSTWPEPVPVRLHSACLTGDLFGSLRCDCGEQLRRSLRLFCDSGGGVLLYLEQEGRGIGLGNKLRAYSLQQEGLDTVDADCVLGFGADERSYDAAVGILRHLGVEQVRLLTNNPEKLRALEDGGIRVVDRTPLHGTLNRHNLPYVRAKVQRAGHWLGDMLHGGTGD